MTTYQIRILWGTSVGDFKRNEIRDQLRDALNEMNLLPCWMEEKRGKGVRDLLNAGGSPSLICVNGHKIFCLEDNSVLPSKEQIIDKIKNYSRYSRKRDYLKNTVSVISGILIALFPKCPVCWATYMSILGIAGSTGISYNKNILFYIVFVAFANLAYTFYKLRASGNFMPLFLQVAGYLMLFINRGYLGNDFLIVVGISLLFMSAFATHVNLQKFMNLFKFNKNEFT